MNKSPKVCYNGSIGFIRFDSAKGNLMIYILEYINKEAYDYYLLMDDTNAIDKVKQSLLSDGYNVTVENNKFTVTRNDFTIVLYLVRIKPVVL